MCPQSLSCLSPGRESCPRVARLYTLPVGLGRGWGGAGEEGGRRRSCASMDVEEVKADSLYLSWGGAVALVLLLKRRT